MQQILRLMAKRRFTTDKLNKYSHTLNLPDTNFPMRADAIKREPPLLSKSLTSLYQWQHEVNTGPPFLLHDGPPYANGKPHMGHALNKITKDIINRYKILQGYRVNYIPGWDCHGLPIELKATEKLSEKEKRVLAPGLLREKARACALEAIKEQAASFSRWGVLGNWENHYSTMSYEYESNQLGVFFQMYQKGLIHRAEKPVYWSPSSRTALAEAELEYVDTHVSRAIYVSLPITQFCPSANHLSSYSNVKAIIWTTTPWTLPANLAICVNEDLEYSLVESAGGDHWLIASDRVESVETKLGGGELRVKEAVNGKELVGCRYQRPLCGAGEGMVVAARHVTSASGSGLVHTAPGHGFDDYFVGKNHDLPAFSPVDGEGRYTSEAGEGLEGLEVHGQGSKVVLQKLRESGQIVFEENYSHKYPYDWRTKKPIIIRATKQWFTRLQDLRTSAVNALSTVATLPPTGKQILEGMVRDRQDWCISRQRFWGLPLPVFYHVETDEPVITQESISHLQELFLKHGSDCWWTLDIQQLLPPSLQHDASQYRKGQDTMDVWFDSGVSWSSVLRKRGLNDVADLYLEGSDQHRGWFQSSLLTCVALEGRAPYKQLIVHGFVLDEKGRKMSKSLGNVVDPSLITEGGKDLKREPGYGADVLRLWVATTDITKDVHIGSSLIAKIGDSARKIRNSFRFMLANTFDFEEKIPLVPQSELLQVDQFILHRLAEFVENVTEAFEAYNFAKAVQQINRFTNVDLSSFYFDVSKDRLYADPTSSLSRRAAQTTLYFGNTPSHDCSYHVLPR
eukprot:TRINITY_DN2918_c0_g1_i1.p1 TRINITY_DN2918_c0_g1~~TRINITY_DN2918_c0_g1_i1.p1  ORF type:complete len:795 (-),score=126.92 TRINITY_DN2918_c0_g1_i1:506-2890(-)